MSLGFVRWEDTIDALSDPLARLVVTRELTPVAELSR